MKKSLAIAGSLDYINLSEVFQLLGTNSSTGILRVISRYNENPGIIYFLNGDPVDADCGPLTGLDAVFPLFGWIEGEFEFSLQSVKNKVVIKKNRMEIVLEAMKMLDDGIIVKQTPVYYDKNKGDSDSELPIVRGPLVDYMYVADEEDYRDGETVIHQGKHGDWSWVVLSGILEIRKETPKGQIPILRLGSGSFIGSIAAYQIKNTVRTYTVVTVGEVQLGVLDTQRLSLENAKFSRNLSMLIISLEKRLKQCANRLTDLLIKKTISDEPLKGKEPIIKQGENKEEAFIIDHGSAYITRKKDKGQAVLARLGDNDFVGKIPFLNMGHEPYSASVYASEDLKLKPLEIEELQKEYEDLSTTTKNMIENNASIISALTMKLSE
ncbi:MAG: cyclic nucleotide-binding domain-containing protein [Deltaproteobacteria bacterium]|nr:cyclic nucleotide-binding domain-containing protein [Deltaproteobacteria bacterium]